MKRAVIALAIVVIANLAVADDLPDIRREVAKRHDEAVKRLQDWIALPSIAAEDRKSFVEYLYELGR
jgi:hypothetical protein